MKMTFLFIHGSFESPEDAWFPWLKHQMENSGNTVIAPQFPVDSWPAVSKHSASEYAPKQHVNAWLGVFESIKGNISKDTKLCVVAHSLGPLFSLLAAQKYSLPIYRAYFVAPFFEVYGKSEYIEKANDSFYHQTFDFPKLLALLPKTTVIYSDDDPYIDEEKSMEFAEKMHSRVYKFHGLGHMGLESGMKDFPQLLSIIRSEMKEQI